MLTPNLAGAAEDLAGLEPVKTIKSRWPMVIAGALTLAMVVGLIHQLLKSGLTGLSHATPTSWLYYVAFVLLYFSPPIGDYIIFRKLWRIPLEGLGALMKKRIANEVVLGYSGEAYFYAWARQRAQMVAAPFGAVKDVMILSAIAGNIMTLAMTALAMSSLPPEYMRPMLVGMGVVVAMCLPFLFFSRRVFSLDRKTLWWVFAVHIGRLAVGSLAIAFAWHFAMPAVSIGVWLTLSATRMMVSRLPFLPSKDTVFATVAIGLLGAHNDALKSLMAFTAAAILLTHVVLAAGFALQSLIKRQI
ncbi:MAG: hypothetical protein E7773_09235 [Sphingomonas sp.]|nr:MAG: hypothetical protein E7773_09235 [Sphingomonas sp.]